MDFHWLAFVLLCGSMAHLAGCAAATSSITSRDQPSDKTFLNLTLPGSTEFTPIVIEATPERTIVARISRDVGGRWGRDIQVLASSGDEWTFVGDRGRELLGPEVTDHAAPFLADARRDARGRLWIAAATNRREGGQVVGHDLLLYRLDGENWTQAAPPLQEDVMLAWRGPLHFTDAGDPFIVYGVAGGRGRPFAMTPTQDTWQPIALQDTLQADMDALISPAIAEGAGRVWIAWRTADRSAAKLLAVSLANPKDVLGPWVIDAEGGWPRAMAVSPEGQVLVTLARSGGDRRSYAAVIDAPQATGADVQPRVRSVPMPPHTSAMMSDVAWSPDGQPCLAANVSPQEARVWFLTDNEDGWHEMARATQPREQGEIFGLRLFFRSDGDPIVTWEDFYPHHRGIAASR